MTAATLEKPALVSEISESKEDLLLGMIAKAKARRQTYLVAQWHVGADSKLYCEWVTKR
jgi:hypothetical protein